MWRSRRTDVFVFWYKYFTVAIRNTRVGGQTKEGRYTWGVGRGADNLLYYPETVNSEHVSYIGINTWDQQLYLPENPWKRGEDGQGEKIYKGGDRHSTVLPENHHQ